jgi:hypothetical protein
LKYAERRNFIECYLSQVGRRIPSTVDHSTSDDKGRDKGKKMDFKNCESHFRSASTVPTPIKKNFDEDLSNTVPGNSKGRMVPDNGIYSNDDKAKTMNNNYTPSNPHPGNSANDPKALPNSDAKSNGNSYQVDIPSSTPISLTREEDYFFPYLDRNQVTEYFT